MSERDQTPGARLRVILEPGVSMGPGKADLLDGIARTGSIAAAGQALGMSYKRAWGLVRRMNQAFGAPLVATTRGGQGRGGAALTALGTEVLARFRRLEHEAARAMAPEIAAMRALLPPRDG